MITQVTIHSRNDGQAVRSFGVKIGDKKLSELDIPLEDRSYFISKKLSHKEIKKIKKQINYKWQTCKDKKTKSKKMITIKGDYEQTFKVSHDIIEGVKLNYIKLLFYNNHGENNAGSCRYCVRKFKIKGCQI